jgi:hypothetical protein
MHRFIVPLLTLAATGQIATAQVLVEELDGSVFPSEAGWTYLVLGNGATAEQAFSLGRGTILQSTVGLGYAGQGSNYWRKIIEVPNPSSWVLEARVRVSSSEIWSFPFGSYVAFGPFGVALMSNSLSPFYGGWYTISFDATQWHTYRMESTACGNWALFVDGSLITYGNGAQTSGQIELQFGDGTGGANANAEYDFVRLTVNLGIGADLNGDGIVDAQDLAILLGAWGQPGVTDLNCSGTTEAGDLAVLLGAWG